MSEDTKQMSVFCVGFVALAEVLSVAGFRCTAVQNEVAAAREADRNAAVVRCVEAGADPLECRAAVITE